MFNFGKKRPIQKEPEAVAKCATNAGNPLLLLRWETESPQPKQSNSEPECTTGEADGNVDVQIEQCKNKSLAGLLDFINDACDDVFQDDK